jgi:hypothetical protein
MKIGSGSHLRVPNLGHPLLKGTWGDRGDGKPNIFGLVNPGRRMAWLATDRQRAADPPAWLQMRWRNRPGNPDPVLFRTGGGCVFDVARPLGVPKLATVSHWNRVYGRTRTLLGYGVPSFSQLRPWIWISHLHLSCVDPVQISCVYLHVPSGATTVLFPRGISI